jgi:hypothetical protein
MSHILKNQNKKNTDRYSTANLSVMQRTIVYEKKLSQVKGVKQVHKTEVLNLRNYCSSSINGLNLKLDEMTKKMKNEIHRLHEESRRHEDLQKTENKKIDFETNNIKKNCDGLKNALKEILDRVVVLEKTFGPTNN